MKLAGLFKKKNEVPHCSAVIVAAGSSQRMGSDKTMMELGSMPVLARTLCVFQQSELVDEIIVVARREKLTEVADLCKKYGVDKVSKVISGGATRMESALAGVSEVNSRAKLIAIHDGVRPLVTRELISRTVYAAAEYMAAVPVIRSVDTLKQVDDQKTVVGSVDREHTLRVQTPQVFHADIIKGALTVAVNRGLTFTDDCSAVELMAVKTHVVPGDEDNIKLTTPRDLLFASAILRDRGDAL